LRSTPLASLFGDGDSGASSAQQQPEYFYRYLKTFLSWYRTLGAVLGIRDILVRIRIRTSD
jgi:hypothetical protein